MTTGTIQLIAEQPWVDRLGWTLVHFLWQGVAIAALYAAARRWLGNSRGPQARYLLACVALVFLVAAPVVNFLLDGAPDSLAPIRIVTPDIPSSTSGSQFISLPSFTGHAWRDEVMPWLVIAWFAGAICFWLRMLGGWVVAARMRIMLVRPAPREWQRTLDMLAARIRVSRPVQLLVSGLVQVPTVVGWLRPVVLVPIGALSGLPPEQVEALLAHELAHIRRQDYLVNVLQSAAEALLFYHPAVWWISSHIGAEREHCCDDVAVAIGGDVLTYTRALAGLESHRPAHFSPALAANGGSLTDRVARLLGVSRPPSRSLSGSGAIVSTVVILVAALAVFGQSAAAPVSFDVASIKPNNSGDNHYWVRIAPGGRLTASNATLRSFVSTAYQVRDFELTGGPAWLDSARYDIEARGQGNPGPPQILEMLQTLLADRFQLRIHKETRELPIYALRIAKNGPKLKPSQEGGCFDPTAGIPPPAPDARPCGGFNNSDRQMLGAKVAMPRLAANLSRFLGRTVVDKTGIDGVYDITLNWTPDETQASASPAEPALPSVDSPGSIFTSVHEQLGLRLESQKGPVEILVIDHAERPSEN